MCQERMAVLNRWGLRAGLHGFANVPPKALAILLKYIFLQGYLL